MAKKKVEEIKTLDDFVQSSSDYIKETSREYSIYVCETRAIPSVADGLKDAQRKALWLLRNRSDKIKTISHAGEMISSGLYVHGDASAAGAISMLAAPYVNNVPFLEGIGSFGSRVSPVDGIGAPRYTYVKKNEAVQKIMFNDLDIVPLEENYDGSAFEPKHFLPLIPTVLLNGVSGIAVGWSTEILPRSFKSLVDATLAVLKGNKIKNIEPFYERYDVGVKNVEGNIWEFTGKVSITDSSTLRVTELPPDLSLEKFKERLNVMEDEGKINTYTDRSTKVIDIIIKMPRGSVKGWTEEKAIDFLKLKQRKTERIVVIDWNGRSIKQYKSAEEVITAFAKWRLEWYLTRYQKKVADDEYELKYWKGVKACFDGKLPEYLLKMKDRQEVINKIIDLTSKIDLDDSQVNKITNIPIYRWAKEEYEVVKKKIAELQARIKENKAIVACDETRKNIYISELEQLKKCKF